MSRQTVEWQPISSEEMTHYLNKARSERAEAMAHMAGLTGAWFRGLFRTAPRNDADREVHLGHLATRGR